MSVNFRRLTDGQYDQDQFDIIYVSSPDLHGVSRGRFVLKSSFPGVVRHGLGLTKGAMLSGVKADMPIGLADLEKEGWISGVQMPDMATLRPLSWLSTTSWKVGHVICDFECSDGKREMTSSREIAQTQIRSLKSLGLEAVSSATAEFTIFYKSTLTPVPLYENTSTLLFCLTRELSHSGILVEAVGMGLEPGKLQISLTEQPVLDLADTIYRLRQAVRSICRREGYDVTFMTRALPDLTPNRIDYTWRLLNTDQSNIIFYNQQSGEMASVVHHWLAGQLAHNGAICALARPTVNCYSCRGSRTQEVPVILKNGSDKLEQASWTTDNANSSTRINITREKGFVRFEDTLASSASNPYLVLSAVLAAGMDGLINKIDLPARNSAQTTDQKVSSPQNLKEALECLDKDKAMARHLGELFIERYLYLKTDFEIKRLENNCGLEAIQDGVAACPFERDRAVYQWSL